MAFPVTLNTVMLYVQAVPNLANCASFACGPPALTAAYADMLQRLDFPMDHLYQESFAF